MSVEGERALPGRVAPRLPVSKLFAAVVPAAVSSEKLTLDTMKTSAPVSIATLVSWLSASGFACSSPVDVSRGIGHAAGAGVSNAANGSSSDQPGNTGGASATAPTIDVDAPGNEPAMIDEATACGTGEATTALREVSLFVMFDRSWSMNECGDGTSSSPMTGGMSQSLDCPTASRWELTSLALRQFVEEPRAAGINIALRFFPDDKPSPGCDGYATTSAPGTRGGPGMMGGAVGTPAAPNCDLAACARPLVDIAPLLADPAPVDAHEADLVAAIAAATPPGPAMPNPNPGTPTYAALGGAEQWALAYQGTHPEAQTAVVLVTDGEPYGCDTSTTSIARLASDARGAAGILTYVIGLTGSSEPQLNEIAAAGGTEQAYFVTDGSAATADLLSALLAIRGKALMCDFAVPAQDSAGKEIDPRLVNVSYRGSNATDAVDFGNVPSADACGGELAWYFDDSDAPTHIYLCPAACETVTADDKATLRILAGCKPRVVVR
jgi:hypothetical protein